MEKEIQTQYRQAQKEITSKWNKYMERADKRLQNRQNALSVALSSGDKEKIAEARKALENAQKAVTLQNAKYKAMVEDTALRISESNQTAIDYINNRTPNIYANNYNQVNGIAEDAGVQFRVINEDVVKKRIREGDIKLPKSRLSVPKDVRWNTKKMNSSVLQGILQGESMNDIAKRLLPIVDNNVNSALRNARTLVTQAENSGRLDSYKALEEEGAVLKKVWMATSDDRTREAHADLDGQEVDVDEPFVDMDGNELMFPADPSADPMTVYNCRCTMVTRIVSVNGKKTETEEEEPKTEEPQEQPQAEREFTPAESIEEAERFIGQYVDSGGFGAVGVSYAGIDLDVANGINKVLSGLLEDYPVGKIGGIVAPAGNTKMGKAISGSTAAYSPIRKSFLLNRKSMGSTKKLEKALKAESDAAKMIYRDIDKFDLSKMSAVTRRAVENGMVSKRITIPETLEEVLYHEYGHALEKSVYASPLWSEVEKAMPDFAKQLSGYACENKSEYIAESFCSYMKGEKLLDPNLETIFRGVKNNAG